MKKLAIAALVAIAFVVSARPAGSVSDTVRVTAIDKVSNTFLPVKGTANGDGTVSLDIATAPGSTSTVKVKQPDSIADGVKVDVLTTATLLVAADPRTDHVILSGFDQTTATVWIGNSTVTVFTGAKPGDGIVTGSPPVVYTTSAALYGRVVGPASQTIVVKKVFHSVAP